MGFVEQLLSCACPAAIYTQTHRRGHLEGRPSRDLKDDSVTDLASAVFRFCVLTKCHFLPKRLVRVDYVCGHAAFKWICKEINVMCLVYDRCMFYMKINLCSNFYSLHTRVRAHPRGWDCLYVYIHMYIYTYTYVCIHTKAYKQYRRIHMDIFMYMHIYRHICECIYT